MCTTLAMPYNCHWRMKVSYYLDKRKLNKDGLASLKIRISHKGRNHYEPVMKVDPNVWERIETAKTKRSYTDEMILVEKKAREVYNSVLETAEYIGAKFSIEHFKQAYHNLPADQMTLPELFNRRIKDLKQIGQEGSALVQRDARNSFIRFFGNTIKLHELSPGHLERYEYHMRKLGRKVNTISIYVRAFQSSVNLYSSEVYANLFGEGNYAIPNEETVKDYLDADEIHKLLSLPPTGDERQDRLEAIWRFTFYSFGAQLADTLRLKRENLVGDYIIFVRQKTRTATKKNIKPIVIPLLQQHIDILNKYGNQSNSSNAYLFDFLRDDMSELTKVYKIKDTRKYVNGRMQERCDELGITKSVTIKSARDAVANALKQAGIPIQLIGEGLGHTTTATTEKYFTRFPTSHLSDAMKKILEKE